MDPTEGGELDEEIHIKMEEFSNKIIVAVGCCQVYGGGIPPFVASALPMERKVRGRHLKKMFQKGKKRLAERRMDYKELKEKPILEIKAFKKK